MSFKYDWDEHVSREEYSDRYRENKHGNFALFLLNLLDWAQAFIVFLKVKINPLAPYVAPELTEKQKQDKALREAIREKERQESLLKFQNWKKKYSERIRTEENK